MPLIGVKIRSALVVGLTITGAVAFTAPYSHHKQNLVTTQPIQFGSTNYISFGSVSDHKALFSSKNDHNDFFNDDIDDEIVETKPRVKKSKALRKKLKKWRRLSSITLAFFTTSIGMNSFQNQKLHQLHRPPAASAMGPNLLAPRLPENAPKTGKALEDEISERAARNKMLQEQAVYEKEASRVFREEGSEAHQEYIKNYRQQKHEKFVQRRKDRKALINKLLFEDGLDPFNNMRGKAILFQFDYGVDLYQEPGTVHNNYEDLKRSNPEKYTNLEEMQKKDTFERVEKMKSDGMTPDEIVAKFKADSEIVLTDKQIWDRDFEIMKRQRDEAQKKREVQKRQKQMEKLAKTNPALYQKEQELKAKEHEEAEKARDEAKVEQAAEAAEEAELKAQINAGRAKNLKEKAKEEAKALKEKQKLEKKKAKEEAKALKEKEKEEKKAEKAAAKAAAAAAAALASASAASTAASSVGAVAGDIVDGASTVIEQSAEESTGESEVGTEETAETATADVDMPVAPSSKKDIPIVPAAAVVGVAAVGGGGFAFKYMKNKAASDEEERQRQFDLIMGNVDESTDSSAPSFADLDDDPATVPDVDEPSAPAKDVETTSTPAAAPPKKKKKGMGSIFSKKASSGRETNINNLFAEDALAPDFTLVLAQYLTFGAPGRFPKVVNLPSPKGYTIPETFESENAKKDITKVREDAGLTDVMAAELFATVVNCMIIDIIDLASSTLTMKGDEKEKDKKTVDALNVVMDFMDHAAGLFDAVADVSKCSQYRYCGELEPMNCLY